LIAAAWFLGLPANARFCLGLGFVVLIILLFREYIPPLGQNDLYTFGFDGRNFAVLDISGKVKQVVKPAELEMIHILAAQMPGTRTRIWRGNRSRGFGTPFTRFGEKKLVNGKKLFVDEPMALLLTKEQQQGRNMYWMDICYPKSETLLYNNIGFVISGGNTKIFLKLLQNSACPVMMNREFYELHRERLDGLFAQANMDMGRLNIE
jgi:hypothetical protein